MRDSSTKPEAGTDRKAKRVLLRTMTYYRRQLEAWGRGFEDLPRGRGFVKVCRGVHEAIGWPKGQDHGRR